MVPRGLVHRTVSLIIGLACAPLAGVANGASQPAGKVEYLSDKSVGLVLKHSQQWGDFGRDTAAAKPGTPGSPMRIGQKTYARGLGHHANGEIVVGLQGQYTSFDAWLGVQWQGGQRGSVIFKVLVDGTETFASNPMADSDPAQKIHIDLRGAKELRLLAQDAGDGFACDMANWAEARLQRDSEVPAFGRIHAWFNKKEAPLPSSSVCGLSILAGTAGPQLAVMAPAAAFTVGLDKGEEVRLSIPAGNITAPARISAEVQLVQGGRVEVEMGLGRQREIRILESGKPLELVVTNVEQLADANLVLCTRGLGTQAGIRWRRITCTWKDRSFDVPLLFKPSQTQIVPSDMPTPHPAIEQALIEWDWRMQDGISTPREPRNWSVAIANILRTGDPLIRDLTARNVRLSDLAEQWETLRRRQSMMIAEDDDPRWEELWRQAHQVRRQIAFRNPLAQIGPLLFVKRVPSSFSHQLTQDYGHCARPGGGVYVLKAPGHSMAFRKLAALPSGSYLHPDVSWDGQRVLFSFCETDQLPGPRQSAPRLFYHLYEMASDGSGLRQVTKGPYDDFSPRYLPDGRIVFLSTRRGGFHRCGRGPCPVYTLAIADADGGNPRPISYHETHEWDPAVMNDGRIIYTRWDYVDRHAVHYQQLWTARPDGSDVRAFYGNNTFNPVGVWEARSVPGSHRVIATAAAHHAMTAGSIILLDATIDIDGLDPIQRLTPDVLFPESEFPVGHWHAPVGVKTAPVVPVQENRWPGHCYRTPYPLSEDYFLAAYSFDGLIGEPDANPANMFGIYWVDRFGNKELLYRDLNIGSLWPTPLRPRPAPPVVPSVLDEQYPGEGTFLVQNVYESWPVVPASAKEKNTITHLRIVQVLPKTTPHINNPKVGLANASPGKQVLGTVPVESDGSAYFRAPAGVPLSFQALDKHGMAVQTMRSLTYVQPGEQATCIGCHERRTSVPRPHHAVMALHHPPTRITPGPAGSNPLSYPILVQPVLDKHCVSCHAQNEPAGGIALTGEPEGAFTVSYNALAPLTAYSEWRSTPQANGEPLTYPGQFGALASKLMALLQKGHQKVQLSTDEMTRLATWMDANALFYGTFDPADQQRQQRGEHIAGPALE